MTAPPKMTALDWTLMALLSAVWGGSFFFVELALRDLPVLTIVQLRVGGAALILVLVLALWGGRPVLSPAVVLTCLVMGLLNNAIPFSLLVWAQTGITSGLAAILNATTPVFTLLVAWAAAAEPLSRARVAGILLGFAGVVILMAGGSLTGTLWAQVACIGAALSYGCAAVWARRFARLGVRPIGAAAGQLVASTLLLLPLTMLVDRPWTLPAPGAVTLAAVVALAVASTALAYLLYFRILASAGSVNLSLVTLLVPVGALLLGVGVLGEQVSLQQACGMAVIGLGLVVIDGRLLSRRSHR